MNETVLASEIPGAPRVPHQDIMLDISQRIAHLSDTVNAPDGSIALRFASLSATMRVQHEDQMTVLRKIFDEVFAQRQRLDGHDQDIKDIDLEMRNLSGDRPSIEIQ